MRTAAEILDQIRDDLDELEEVLSAPAVPQPPTCYHRAPPQHSHDPPSPPPGYPDWCAWVADGCPDVFDERMKKAAPRS